MDKLKDILNTRYVYDDYIPELTKLFDKIEAIDLADCKFTPEAERIIKMYYGKVLFTNSADPELNKLLLHNNGTKVDYKADFLPLVFDFNSVDDLLRLFSSINQEGKYIVKQEGVSQPKRIAAIIMLTMMFPKVTLEIGHDIVDVFALARTEWLKANKHHDEYFLLDGISLARKTVDASGNVKMFDGTSVKEELFVHMYKVLPIDFGTRMIVKDDEFSLIFQRCLQVLDAKHETELRMLDFLERRH